VKATHLITETPTDALGHTHHTVNAWTKLLKERIIVLAIQNIDKTGKCSYSDIIKPLVDVAKGVGILSTRLHKVKQ